MRPETPDTEPELKMKIQAYGPSSRFHVLDQYVSLKSCCNENEAEFYEDMLATEPIVLSISVGGLFCIPS